MFVTYSRIARTIAIIYVLFISIFALDVFEEEYVWSDLLVALLMHLVPSLIFLGALILAWKRPLYGGIVFLLVGLGTILFFKTHSDLMVFAMISLPPLIAGTLFIRSFQKSQKKT